MDLRFYILLPILALSACKKNENTPAPNGGGKPNGLTVSAIEGFVARPTTLTEFVTASGSLAPAEETALHPEASGRVVSINLPEGKTVRKGELLLKIFDEDLKTQLRKVETQLKQAEITEQRLGELLKVKGVSQQEYDLAALQTQTLRSELDLLRINIAKTELRAPYDGVLGLRRISPGAYVTPATAVATIRSSGGLKLDFAVPEKYGAQIRGGQSVSFTVEGSSQEHVAVIQATEQTISEESRNLLVRAGVRDSRGLLPGAFAEVNLNLGGKNSALMIPTQSIIPQARDKKVILNKNGKARFVTVTTGVRQADMVEITGGISAGDTVCTTGMLFLRPEAPLTFSKVE